MNFTDTLNWKYWSWMLRHFPHWLFFVFIYIKASGYKNMYHCLKTDPFETFLGSKNFIKKIDACLRLGIECINIFIIFLHWLSWVLIWCSSWQYLKKCLIFQYWFDRAWNWIRSLLLNQFTRVYDSRWVLKLHGKTKGHQVLKDYRKINIRR